MYRPIHPCTHFVLLHRLLSYWNWQLTHNHALQLLAYLCGGDGAVGGGSNCLALQRQAQELLMQGFFADVDTDDYGSGSGGLTAANAASALAPGSWLCSLLGAEGGAADDDDGDVNAGWCLDEQYSYTGLDR
jgi:hypothetical protein